MKMNVFQVILNSDYFRKQVRTAQIPWIAHVLLCSDLSVDFISHTWIRAIAWQAKLSGSRGLLRYCSTKTKALNTWPFVEVKNEGLKSISSCFIFTHSGHNLSHGWFPLTAGDLQMTHCDLSHSREYDSCILNSVWNNNISLNRWHLPVKRHYKFVQVTKWDGVSGLSERQGVAAKRKKKTRHKMWWLHWLVTDVQCLQSGKKTTTGNCFIWQTLVFPTYKKEENELPASLPHRRVSLIANKYYSPNPFEQLQWAMQ